MQYFAIFMLLVSYLLISMLISLCFDKIAMMKLAMVSAITTICAYVCISAILFCLDVFQIQLALSILFGLSIVMSCFLAKGIVQHLKHDVIDFDLKKSLGLLLILALCLPFTMIKAESVITAFDPLIYGEKALALLYENTSVKSELREYAALETQDEKELQMELEAHLGGINYYEPDSEGKIYYEYHALPGWPAVLALFGYLLGYRRMFVALSIFYIIATIAIYYIVDSLTDFRPAKYVGAILFAFSSLAIYLAKDSVSEMMVTSIILVVIVLLCERQKGGILTAFIWGTIGLVHISIFSYMPLWFICLLLLYLKTNDKWYAINNVMGMSLHFCSLPYCFIVSSQYSSRIFASTLGGVARTPFYTLLLFGIVLMCMIGVQFILIKKKQWAAYVYKNFTRYISCLLKAGIVLILIGIAFRGYQLGFTDTFVEGTDAARFRTLYANRGAFSLLHLNLFSILLGSSVICLPFVVFKIFTTNLSFPHVLLGISTLFTLVLHTLLRVDTPMNYYASRYFFIMLIPLLIILTAILLNGKVLSAVFVSICILLYLPSNLVLSHARLYGDNFERLEHMRTVIPVGSVVYIEDNHILRATLVNNLRIINKAWVFPTSLLENEISALKGIDQYLISDTPFSFDSDVYNSLVYEGTLPIRYDNFHNDKIMALYPYSINYQSMKIFVYRIISIGGYQEIFPDDNICLSNFYRSESGLVWSKNKSEYLSLLGNTKDIAVKIDYLSFPEYVLSSMKEMNISVYVKDSGEEIYSTTLTSNVESAIEFVIPSSSLNPGVENWIVLECDSWSPSELSDSLDTRELGLPIRQITLQVIPAEE